MGKNMPLERFQDYKSKLEVGLTEHPELDVAVLSAVTVAVKNNQGESKRIGKVPFELSVPFPAYRERLDDLVTQIGLKCVGMYHMPSNRWKLALEEKPGASASSPGPLVVNFA